MNQRIFRVGLAALLAASTLAAVGCQQSKTSTRSSRPQTTTKAKPAAKPIGHMRSANGMAFPTGNPSTSALFLETMSPEQVVAGEAFDLEYRVTNISDLTLNEVIVFDEGLSGMTVRDSTPASRRTTDGRVSWPVGTLQPGESKAIRIRAVAGGEGSASSCATVSFGSQLCSTIQIVQPKLQLAKSATREALLCDEIILTYRVTNNGSGTARGVTITDDICNGWRTSTGASEVRFDVGDLAAGQSRDYRVAVATSTKGRCESGAVATSAGGLLAKAGPTTTIVTEPVLAITHECGKRSYLGRNVKHTITVKNIGDGVSRSTGVTTTIGNGTVISASGNGQATDSTVTWNIGDLAPGASRTVTLSAVGDGKGTVSGLSTAKGTCAKTVSDGCETDYVGIPAILLEVVDIEDPIEVGAQTTYVITVTNQGSANSTNLRVRCILPDSEVYVSATGPTDVAADGRTLTMDSVGVLPPGQKATWHITIRAIKEDDARFRVSMVDDYLAKQNGPVEEDEPTNLYR